MRARHSTLLATFAAAALALAACGGAGGEEPDPAATGAETGEAAGSDGDASGFPVEVEHAFGSTKITEEPARVVTWGWGSTEAAIALGVFPVGMTEQVWTVGAGNQLPWIADAVEAAGEEPPALLTDDFTAPPYEEIIALEPDLILAPYSGIDEEQYTLLGEIAPTVAYPEGPWATPWRDVIDIVASALGRDEAGDQVLADIDAFFTEQAAAHPEFAGVTIANVWDGDGVLSVYTSLDPRVAMLTDLGFEVAPSVDELDTDSAEGNFYYELSYEQIDKLEADLLISYHSTQEEADAFLDKPEVQAIPAVAEGRVAQVVGNEYVSSVSPPTALSVEWGMPDLIEAMSAALE
ncbi:MAG TPA: iron-siderophore ABC transporter substrate-binding protein [Egicoccus sp.]|nr:iron-siderophore ABC transporter substrate-binding protein [Egicoccus sp.]HSK23012.1 iron-siderophore ABC transporter substrate-binding protein [Egicoccus sp.]